MSEDTTCPCGSRQAYARCCGVLHHRERKAVSPGELMRARYSAYALGNGPYLMQTVCKANRAVEDVAVIEEFVTHADWIKLEILNERQERDTGFVEFKAYYRKGDTIGMQYEKSRFIVEEGEWFYKEGELSAEKIARNEPCPCGSGKKYKRCCKKG